MVNHSSFPKTFEMLPASSMNLLENVSNLIYYHPAIMCDLTCGYLFGFASSFGVNYMTGSIHMALNRFSGELENVS
jgi:hypothetical protein